MLQAFKRIFFPNRPIRCPIVFGPLRGAWPLMNPQSSFRYIFGLYEHELNHWLSIVIPKTNCVFDIGANHGYFCLGIMAAWNRIGVNGSVWAFEPQPEEVSRILRGRINRHARNCSLTVENCFVGATDNGETKTLDCYLNEIQYVSKNKRALVKIDVEGAEIDVLQGAKSLITEENFFLVEVHSKDLLRDVLDFFRLQSYSVDVVEQAPLPWLGRECRSLDNWWVVSKL